MAGPVVAVMSENNVFPILSELQSILYILNPSSMSPPDEINTASFILAFFES